MFNKNSESLACVEKRKRLWKMETQGNHELRKESQKPWTQTHSGKSTKTLENNRNSGFEPAPQVGLLPLAQRLPPRRSAE
jgi:hypothetical protein